MADPRGSIRDRLNFDDGLGCRSAGLLDGARARQAFVLRSSLDPPWSMRIQDEAPLTLVTVVRGSAWVLPDVCEPSDVRDGGAVQLRPGDIAVLRGPEHYTVADDPSTSPQVVIHPGQRCTAADGSELASMRDLGVRNWGNSQLGETVLLTGTYQEHREVSRRLLAALPALLVLTSQSWRNPLTDYLAEEAVKDEPGQEAVLDRLLDLLLVGVLRAWFARPEAGAPGWYRAHGDPVVGPALRLLENDSAHPWTVAELARAGGSSRAGFARRFMELIGEPPMEFLTNWRLTLAADLLREPGSTVASVARQVGYSSPFAFSVAFKRVRGQSPLEHRNAAG